MDSFFDFSQGTTQPSPATASSSKMNDEWTSLFPADHLEERRQFNGPSHDYHQYKQQVGLPGGSTGSLPQQSVYEGYGSGIGDVGFDTTMPGWSSGIDTDADMMMDFNQPQTVMQSMFYAPTADPSDTFINPNTIQEEPTTSNVGRLWPGMHSQQAQQAAMQKAANTQVMQQRQLKRQAQHAQYRQLGNGSQSQAASQPGGNNRDKRASHVSESHVEESISRLLDQMRQNSAAGDQDGDSADDLPHLARMKKDEDEMDEDERLLASEEGKKLSSKERRQLRNKVSARAFRSRRKGTCDRAHLMSWNVALTLLAEYIGQLEGEVAMKAQEASNLRVENQALMQENDRYRGLIETLLRHPAFTPFINDISQDPSVLGPPATSQAAQRTQVPLHPPAPQPAVGSIQSGPQAAVAQQSQQPAPQHQQQPPTQQRQHSDVKPDFLNFDVTQIQVPRDDQQIHLATIPEHDFSKLDLNGFQRAMNSQNPQSVNAFAVTRLPHGPDPDELISTMLAHQSGYTAASDVTTALPFGLSTLLDKLDGAARKLGTSI
nr:bzip-type transcription factor mbz1 [Quercus suber]